MTAAEATCKEGGVIIDCTACNDGHGGEDFFNTLKNAADLQKAMDEILARDRNETIFDQWESQILLRLLLHFHIILVTQAPREMVEAIHLTYAENIDEAFKLAKDYLAEKGVNDPKVTVIPDGVSVIVK